MIIVYLAITIVISVFIITEVFSGYSRIKNFISNQNKVSMLEMDSLLTEKDVKPNADYKDVVFSSGSLLSTKPKDFLKPRIPISDDTEFLYSFFVNHIPSFTEPERYTYGSPNIVSKEDKITIETSLDKYKLRFIKMIISENSESISSVPGTLNLNELRIKRLFSPDDYAPYKREVVVYDKLVLLESNLQYVMNHSNVSVGILEDCKFIYNDYLFDLIKSLYLYTKSCLSLSSNQYLNNVNLFRETSEDIVSKTLNKELEKVNKYKKDLDLNFLLINFSNSNINFRSKFNTIDTLSNRILELAKEDDNNIEIKVTVSNMKTSVIPRIKTWSEDKTLNKKDVDTINVVLDKIINILKSYESNVYFEENEISNEIQIINRYLGYLEKPISELTLNSVKEVNKPFYVTLKINYDDSSHDYFTLRRKMGVSKLHSISFSSLDITKQDRRHVHVKTIGDYHHKYFHFFDENKNLIDVSSYFKN